MKRVLRFVVAIAMATAAAATAAQSPTHLSACLAIDEAHDTFSPPDRQAALILVARQLEQSGREIVGAECSERYVLSHVQLGRTIMVTLAGPSGLREGRAADMDDLPGLYNQIVRALLKGSTVGAMNVVDRTNVTTPQSEPRRVGIDSFGYARLGYGRMLGAGGAGNPSFGFGYRAELDSWGLDVSFLNQQVPSAYAASTGTAGSLLKLQALHFMSPQANASAYFGGGLSWGMTTGAGSTSQNGYQSWSGSGLQGELTAGYELPRASELRVFVQADATLPFYHTTAQSYTYSQGRSTAVTAGRRYNPSIALSVGVGWHRHRR